MPAYPFLVENKLDGKDTAKKMEVMRWLWHPYTDEDIAGAKDAVKANRNGRTGCVPAGSRHFHQEQTVTPNGYRDYSRHRHSSGVHRFLLAWCSGLYSSKRKSSFDEAANLPFADDPKPVDRDEQSSRSNNQ